jgi:hypothetical protein
MFRQKWSAKHQENILKTKSVESLKHFPTLDVLETFRAAFSGCFPKGSAASSTIFGSLHGIV